ncbi:hypothetical protein GCM10008986_21150 [Salinibacillus aidingensis]|uniref:DUF4179 domain-containing protein n=1 Tax=Salinibacillus aidingensis TaxID=237684 RepID=A0ABP3L6P7_9BACI
MSDKDKWLKECKESDMQIPISPKIDDHIKAGIQQARLKQTRKRRISQIFSASAATVMAASILFIAGLSVFQDQDHSNQQGDSLRNSDQEMKDQPSPQDHEAEFTNWTEPNENYTGFARQIEQKETHDDITFTVKEVVADSNQLVINYSIHIDGPPVKELTISNLNLAGENGESPIGKVAERKKSIAINNESNSRSGEMKIELAGLSAEQLQSSGDTWTLELQFSRAEQPFTYKLPINSNWFNSKHYELNKVVDVNGQKLVIHDVILHPTVSKVILSRHPDNDEQILGIHRLALRNGEINQWSSLEPVFFTLDSGKRMITLQNNYRQVPDDLLLSFSKVLAVDEGKEEIVLNLKNEKLEGAPDWMSVEQVEKKNDDYHVTFQVRRELKTPQFLQPVYKTPDGEKGSVSPFSRRTNQTQSNTVTLISSVFYNVPETNKLRFHTQIIDKEYNEEITIPLTSQN